MSTAADTIRAVNERWPHQFPEEVEPEIIEQYDDELWLLVERSTITRDHHLSLHHTVRGAVTYNCEQEYAEDWEPRYLVELATGRVSEVQRSFSASVDETGKTISDYEEWRA